MNPMTDVCGCCKKDRESVGQLPRSLTRLPIEVTQDKLFKRKGMPVRLCDYCDGDALTAAIATHHARTT